MTNNGSWTGWWLISWAVGFALCVLAVWALS
jgi:hypothetical protein